MKEKLEEILSYFEGTCEICLGNLGIEKYRNEIKGYLEEQEKFDGETLAVLFFTAAVIEYKLENLEEAEDFWKKSLEYAKKHKMKKYVGKIHSYLSIIYYVNGQRDLEKKHFLKACKVFEELDDDVDLALHYTNALWYKRYDTNTKEIVGYLNHAIEYAGKSDSNMNARVYLHIGYIYKTIFNDFIRGIHYLLMANKMCRENDWIEMETMTFHVLADGYLRLAHYKESEEIYANIFESSRYADITANLKCAMEVNLVCCYLITGEIEKALYYIRDLEKNAENAQVNIKDQFKAVAGWLRAWFYIESKTEKDKVLPLLKKAEEEYKKHEKSFILENFDYAIEDKIGDYYMSVSEYDKAIESYKRLENISKPLGESVMRIVCEKLANAYEATEDYKHSLEYRKKEDKFFEKANKHNIFVQYEKMYKDFFNTLNKSESKRERKIKNEMKSTAYVDELTNLKNDRFFEKYMESYMVEIPLIPGKVAIAIADIDDFSAYNEAYGEKSGDELLEILALALREEFSLDNVKLIRYKADTFIVIAEDVEEDVVKKLSNDLINNFKRNNKRAASGKDMTLSIGGCIGTVSGGDDIKAVYDYAQKELYKVKRIAKGNVSFYEYIV